MSNAITRNAPFSRSGYAQNVKVDTDIQMIVDTINNADAGITTWSNIKATTITPGGDIAMGNHKLTGLSAGTGNGDSLRYEQLIGLYLLLTGGTMSGAIAMGTNKITGLSAGTTNGDALRYEQLINVYLLLTGGQLSGNLSFDNNSTHGLVGTATNDNAASGNLGQYISASSNTDTNFPTTGTFDDFLTISLSAGDWDVSLGGAASINTATWTGAFIGVSTTSGNSSTGLTDGNTYMYSKFASSSTTPTATSLSIASARFSFSSTTPVYYKFLANYSAGQPVLNGRISARRVR